MTKTLCDLEESDSHSDRKKAKRLTKGARFGCKRCGRAAAKKKRVCNPKEL